MKKFLKEIIILIIQLFIFYIFPALSTDPTDIMGEIVLIIISIFILALLIGILSKEKIKFVYPLIIAILFAPTILMYYNSSCTVYIIWYFILSLFGVLIGTFIRFILKKILNIKKDTKLGK